MYNATYQGKWTNELGSELSIDTVNSDDTFTGTFTTVVGDDPVKDKPVPLNGRFNGELVSFIADFKGTGSMTCWMGRHERRSSEEAAGEQERINCTWILGRTVEGEDDDRVDMWATFLTNGNVFIRKS